MLFRDLDAVETMDFIDWAVDNYQPLTPINPVWHPVVRRECDRINAAYIRNTPAPLETTDTRDGMPGSGRALL